VPRHHGRIAFKVSNPATAVAKFPTSVIHALAETQGYWRRVVYLEPVFHDGQVLRSITDVKRLICRPKDPIIAGFLGAGPINYGYRFPADIMQKRLSRKTRIKDCRDLVFIVAHWD